MMDDVISEIQLRYGTVLRLRCTALIIMQIMWFMNVNFTDRNMALVAEKLIKLFA